ncbi:MULTISPECIES: efflux RND transporter periplasmic adaptor subunit [Tenacibaculum]|uniref:Efflux RND transporter periplasmic adaptor subunit n=2 Tax=Tenacibaculum TaxID=104267 RepID=A0ABN5T3C1_9FLAO|nr:MULTISPECIES: efflux RND transporter periplasmic adaptor subunit [Tenacibaculum]GFD75126.1 RND transporter MFP subunit [Tenacibaculum sp. KUL113]GFD82142.1 RND transporter MFP subunit [Tenacibaculum sp. KUL118]GFD92909.1 RND transporter MFP subunit [Alteromonas sp. KUL154]GFD99638.1 RND transporter MFP subunit [Alteromonas sp. KUL156]AZJ31598.1 efflux RND transporter periplasmic adaptor subunit [Tenacibaculum mesophilum]|eukprot:TRINITY_DN3319_c0_g1_i2.p2 TRINITY_DN3319_c0_g1~~TRINITY_DN3319_c0_g1_i2.p2  ORF type:complete len:369 (-),score=99.86 TRINITY_DN3319_c0_g1_i2:244-1350(-)
MSKRAKIILGIVALLFVVILIWLGKKNQKSVVTYETEKPFRTTIVKKAVATGKVVPLEEVEIKPQIAGIIDKIVVEEGAIVKAGDLLATVRVVPNEQSLQSARGMINSIQIRLNNAKTQYDRNKNLFDKGVISSQDFEASQLSYNQAKNDLRNAQNDYQIIKKGSVGSAGANTNIRATTSGMVVEIPVKKGYQVIQSNNFNEGTTIATIADMEKMIFEGKVDESEVGKLVKGSNIEVSLGAIENKKFPAILNFIAPKGTEENGAVQFKIKADVKLDDNYFVRAGYSANADIVLEKKDSVLSIKESLLRFDKKTEEPYVEIKKGDEEFEKRELKLGVSDGVNIEVLEGVTASDEIKIWNKASKDDEKKD